jgi:GTP cyclohydrolase II
MLRVSQHGGAVVYLYEEGRGVGLADKMRAIHLQQTEGLTSPEAYSRLALKSDARCDYSFLREVLQQICGETDWILLTNNPLKQSLVTSAGISVAGSEPLICDEGSPTIKAYLASKVIQFGHRIK